MDGVLVFLIYMVSAVFGFAGGIFGYHFAKRMEKRRAEKTLPEIISVQC